VYLACFVVMRHYFHYRMVSSFIFFISEGIYLTFLDMTSKEYVVIL